MAEDSRHTEMKCKGKEESKIYSQNRFQINNEVKEIFACSWVFSKNNKNLSSVLNFTDVYNSYIYTNVWIVHNSKQYT